MDQTLKTMLVYGVPLAVLVIAIPFLPEVCWRPLSILGLIGMALWCVVVFRTMPPINDDGV